MDVYTACFHTHVYFVERIVNFNILRGNFEDRFDTGGIKGQNGVMIIEKDRLLPLWLS